MSELLPKTDVKMLLLADIDKKQPREFYRDGMSCQGCGSIVHSGDPLYVFGGRNCCEGCKNAIVKCIKEHL